MFSFLSKWTAPRKKPIEIIKSWRTGMWVVYEKRVGILVTLDTIVEIHYTNPISGETVEVGHVPLAGLRQALWSEIPHTRRSITEAQGKVLGYGS